MRNGSNVGSNTAFPDQFVRRRRSYARRWCFCSFLKAERTGNWRLHLAAASSMTPYFFTHDRHNYSRWLSVYLADMEQLQQKHPTVYQRFMEDDHVISRSSQPFSSVWTDMSLEQSINLDPKSKGGIVGISLNADALHRWFLTCHERAAITSAAGRMCGSDDPDRIGTHKEAGLKRVERAENDVQKIITCFKSGLLKDLFAEASDSQAEKTSQLVLFCPPMKLKGCWQVKRRARHKLIVS